MSNGAMVYIHEKEEDSFTIPSGLIYTYTYTGTYSSVKVVVDKWSGSDSPTITYDNLKVDVTGKEGDTGTITLIEL